MKQSDLALYNHIGNTFGECGFQLTSKQVKQVMNILLADPHQSISQMARDLFKNIGLEQAMRIEDCFRRTDM